jgi:hypothetical protein
VKGHEQNTEQQEPDAGWLFRLGWLVLALITTVICLLQRVAH